MDLREQHRENEIYSQSVCSIGMVVAMMNDTKVSTGRNIEESIKNANKAYRKNYIKVRNKVLSTVAWEIRPHVLYRINKYFQHLL